MAYPRRRTITLIAGLSTLVYLVACDPDSSATASETTTIEQITRLPRELGLQLHIAGSNSDAAAAFVAPLRAMLDDVGRLGRPYPQLNMNLALRDAGGAQLHRITQGGAAATALTITVQAVAPADVTSEGYHLSGEDGSYTLRASTALGAQYGLWELLERAGLLYVHPERAILPARLCGRCIGALDQLWQPGYAMRGTHVHTQHPIEYEYALLAPDEANYPQFQNLVAYSVARRQNYLEWILLRTADLDSWIHEVRRLVDYAHLRGLRMGIEAPFAFRQQNTYTLIQPESSAPATAQIAANVDWLMQVPWDFVNVEMGAAEYIPVGDTEQVEWLSFMARYLRQTYPGTHTATKVHSTVDQHAESYGDMNFNYIAQYADSDMGVLPHTVQFYDLYGPAPTYGRENFHDMREFMLSQVGRRPVYYYPETSYWVTFDNDIPIFLPVYMYGRWHDLHQLYGSGITGQINFWSGYEWGSWMGDLASSWAAYAPQDDLAMPLQRALSPLGTAAPAAQALLADYIEWQRSELWYANGIRWLVAWDAADDIGHSLGMWYQPHALRLFEVLDLTDEQRAEFVATELSQLEAIAQSAQSYADRWQNLTGIDDYGAEIWLEIGDGMAITALRAAYMVELYRTVVAMAEAGLEHVDGGTESVATAFRSAQQLRDQALRVVQHREPYYRFPHAQIAQDRPSMTSYPFGYLRTVTDLWYWDRELRLVEKPREYDMLETLYDLADAAGL